MGECINVHKIMQLNLYTININLRYIIMISKLINLPGNNQKYPQHTLEGHLHGCVIKKVKKYRKCLLLDPNI